MKETIKGVVGTYSDKPLEEIEALLFKGCNVGNTTKTPLEYNGRKAMVIGFEIRDAGRFPTLLSNYKSIQVSYQLNLTVFVGSKKVNLEAFK